MSVSAAGIWNIDPGDASVVFGVGHLPIARFGGVLGVEAMKV